MPWLRKIGSLLVVAGVVLMAIAPAVSRADSSPQSADSGQGIGSANSEFGRGVANAQGDLRQGAAPGVSRAVLPGEKPTCPDGQFRVEDGKHKGQCVAAPDTSLPVAESAAESPVAIAGQPEAPAGTELAVASQTAPKLVVVRIVLRSCEVRNGVSETNVTFSFRHDGVSTTGKVEMTINGPTGVIVLSEKTEIELPEGTYTWTARSIDPGYVLDGPTAGEFTTPSCQTASTTTSTAPPTTTTVSSTTTSVTVSPTSITSPSTTTTIPTSSTSSSSTTLPIGTTTTVPIATTSSVPFEPPPELPATGPDDVYWPLALLGAALLTAGMGALAVSRAHEERVISPPS